MKFEVYKKRTFRGARWFWRLKAGNGETIASGEGYKNKMDCLHCVNLVKTASEADISVINA